MSDFHHKMRQRSLAHPRLAGVILLLVGSVMGYFSLWLPISGMQARAQSISIHMASMVFSVGFLLMGGAYVILGRPFVETMYRPREEWSKEFTFSVYFSIAVSIALIVIFELYMYNMGYQRRR